MGERVQFHRFSDRGGILYPTDEARAVNEWWRRAGGRPAVVLTLALLAGACRSGPGGGSALTPEIPGYVSFGPMPPGQQVEALDVELQSRSSQPVKLISVMATGPGVGTVGKIVREEIAPVPNTDTGTNWVPDGDWVTYPPAGLLGHTCRVQQLFPLKGYVLRPRGARVRVAMTLQAVRPGRFGFTSVLVRYSVGGHLYDQRITLGTKFTVQRGVPPRAVSEFERPCVSRVSVLPR